MDCRIQIGVGSGDGRVVMRATDTFPRAGPREDPLLALGHRLRSLRVRRGLTQAELAAVVEVSAAYVSLIERGLRDPPITTVVALARALRAPLASIC